MTNGSQRCGHHLIKLGSNIMLLNLSNLNMPSHFESLKLYQLREFTCWHIQSLDSS